MNPHPQPINDALMIPQYMECIFNSCPDAYTVKPVLSGHSQIDKTKILKTNGSLMKVESIAECLEHSAILLTCIKRKLVL